MLSVLFAKFHKDSSINMGVMHEQNIIWFKFKVSNGLTVACYASNHDPKTNADLLSIVHLKNKFQWNFNQNEISFT